MFNAFRHVNWIMTTKLSWSDWSGIETIHLGRTEHAGNVSMLLNNFPKGFCEGLNWFMGAVLAVFPLELRYFWRGCSGCTLDLKISIKSSWQAHERTYHGHVSLRWQQFILFSQRASVAFIYEDGYLKTRLRGGSLKVFLIPWPQDLSDGPRNAELEYLWVYFGGEKNPEGFEHFILENEPHTFSETAQNHDLPLFFYRKTNGK